MDCLFAFGLVAAVFLVYRPCWYGGFLFDDDLHLLNNPVLKPGGVAKIWVPGSYVNYWPLTFTAYRLQYQFWELKPLGYHLVNIGLHAAAALLVWRVLVQLHASGAMFAAAIFALHPVNVESVAWIAQLKGILSLVLALVSVLFYLRNEQQPSRWRYGLAVAAFLLSALAKGAAITLPAVLLACAWWQRGRISRRDLLRVLPYLLIGAVMAGAEVWNQYSLTSGQTVRSDDFFSRAAVAGCALWFYLGKLILPLKLSPIYPRWNVNEHSLLSYLPGVAWIALLALAWWRRRTWGRPVVMLIVCYSALLLPVLGFVNISSMRYSFVSDHWQYTAMIVPCAVFAGLSVWLGRRYLRGPVPMAAAIAAGAALLLVLAVLSRDQSKMYASAATFYETAITRNPGCWLAENNLGTTLLVGGKVDLAIGHFEKALAIKPDYADAHINIAAALLDRGDVDSAIDHYQASLAINPDDPLAHNYLAVALVRRGEIDSAVDHFKRALEIKPDFADPHFGLGNAYAGRDQSDAAIAQYERALQIKPDYAEAQFNLGNVLLGRGEIDRSIAHYRMALEINPNYVAAHINLATALADRGDLDAAIAHYGAALKIKPDDAAARRNLAIVQSRRDRLSRGEPPDRQPPDRQSPDR